MEGLISYLFFSVIEELDCNCKHKDSGCNWEGEYGKIAYHLSACQFEAITCNDCGKQLLRKRLNQHNTSECTHRLVKCVHCEIDVKFHFFTAHEGKICLKN